MYDSSARRYGAETLDFPRLQSEWANSEPAQLGVILLDKKPLKIDGHEMLVAAKVDEALKHIPIVMLTSSREQIDLLKSYDLGVNAYVVKPVEFGEFMDAIRGIGSWIVINEAPAN